MNPSEYVTVYTDMPKGMLESLGNDFFQESGLKMNVVYLSKSQLQSRQDVSDTPAADLYITSQDSLMKMKKRKYACSLCFRPDGHGAESIQR